MSRQRPVSPPTEPRSLDRARSWVVGLTGVLVVVPALVNSALDVYSVVAKLPKTDSQRLNDELFKKYFNHPPMMTLPIPVKRDDGDVNAKFSVYDGGDIYVEFGKRSQWLPFPKTEKTALAFPSLFSSAYAATKALVGEGQILKQTEQYLGDNIVRQRYWENGVLETITLDPRTGNILDRTLAFRPDLRPSNGASANNIKQSPHEQWYGDLANQKFNSVNLQKFSDGYYALRFPITWEPTDPIKGVRAVNVPRGFVSNFRSTPQIFWASVRPDGPYAFATVILDYLYWEQSYPREVANQIFRQLLIEVGLPDTQAAMFYAAVSQFGGVVWDDYAQAKRMGEKRILVKFPDDETITWADWKMKPENFR